MKLTRRICTAAVFLIFGAACLGTRSSAAEFGKLSSYYEDDSWYDVSEWFDGNDYNPTDESWWRWDDETYQASKDTGGDRDNDAGLYGYMTRGDSDWYYDYYDPYSYAFQDKNNDHIYELGSRYYDYDKDGSYDAVAYYSDTDNDGIYDDFNYHSFGNEGSKRQREQAQQSNRGGSSSKQEMVTGEIQKTKTVQVPRGEKHMVVAIQAKEGQNQQPVIVDLGKAGTLRNLNIKEGTRITVKGPKTQVGDKNVVVAQSLAVNGQTNQVDRAQRGFTAKVLDTHTAKVRGQEHLIAMVQSSQGDQAQKMAVDLGPADELKVNVDKGRTITFNGFPVKVKDRPVLMAQSVRSGGEVVQINRQPRAMGASENEQGQGQEQGHQSSGNSDRKSQQK